MNDKKQALLVLDMMNEIVRADCGAPGHPHGTLPEELRLMVVSGVSPVQALRFGTSGAADLSGLGDEVGSLQPGKRADLLAVDGDPTSDLLALRAVRLVLRDGSVVTSGLV
jgi:imidazolonepropionase-like amidohydrolase